MSDFGMALMEGLGSGLQQWGLQRQQDEDEQKKQAREDAKAARAGQQQMDLERMKEQAAQARLEFEQTLKGPKYDTYETTDDAGKPIKRTVKNAYDAKNHQNVETEVGTAPIRQPAPTTRNVIMGDQEASQQYDPDSGKWQTVGSPGPRWHDRAPRDQGDVTAREEMRQTALNRRAAQKAADSDFRAFDKMDNYSKEEAYTARGIDPKAKDARDQWRKQVMSEKLDTFDLDPVDKAPLMGPVKGQAAAPAVPSAPNAAPAGTPPGAKQAPDGHWYAPDPNRPGKYIRLD